MEMKKYIEKKFSIGGDKFLLLRKLHEDGKISTEELSDLIKYYESALFMKHWEGFFTGLQAFDKDHKKIKKGSADQHSPSDFFNPSFLVLHLY